MENERADMDVEAHVDAATDLSVLRQLRDDIAVEDALDFGPSWYAVTLATTIGGLTIFGAGAWDASAVLFGAIGVAAGSATAMHDYRRRRVRPRASKTATLVMAAILVACWALIAAWGTMVSSVGYDDFVPGWAFLCWLATIAVLLAARGLSLALRDRRRAAA